MTPFIPSGRYWITTQDQPFILSDGETLVIPKGFATDAHSLPPFLLPWLNPYSHDMYAALLHDALYEFQIGTRRNADYEYLYQMQQLGTKPVRRYTFFLFVRLFGWLFW